MATGRTGTLIALSVMALVGIAPAGYSSPLLNPSGRDLLKPAKTPQTTDTDTPPSLTEKQQRTLSHLCKRHATDLEHIPDADVAYQPSPSKHAKHLPDTASALPMEAIDIPLTLPIAPYIDQQHYNVDLSDTRLHPGTLTVTQEGEVLWNGAPLPKQGWQALCDQQKSDLP